MNDAIGQQSLLQVYSVYEKLKSKTTTNVDASASASASTSASSSNQTPNNPSAPNPEAEKLKGEGNKAMQAKDYTKAVDLYTKALALSPSNPIYLSNRAAAYSATQKHAEAAEDAEMAVAADPKYTKAWSRLGLARYALGDPKGSMEAYKKGIDAEGNGGSDAMKRGYETAKRRVEEQEGAGAAEEAEEAAESGVRGFGGSGAGAGGAGGMPDLSSLAGMFGGGRGGGGGMPDLGGLMSNPMFANMAQQVMNNPDMMSNLMNNPQLRSMADRMGGSGGGGGGGMPNLSEMMQDPSLAEMARNLMGGGGAGAGRGRGGAGQ